MAISFDASTKYLSRTTNLPGITAFTMMGWFKLPYTRAAFQGLMCFGTNNGGTDWYYAGTLGDGVTGQLWNAVAQGSGSSFVNQKWTHVALVISGTGAGQALMYRDGVLDVTAAGSAVPTAAVMLIGTDAFSPAEYATCLAENVLVYSAALSQAEVQAQMALDNKTTPARTANLNGWYPLEGDAKDYSGNGYDWTVNGAPGYFEGRYPRPRAYVPNGVIARSPLANVNSVEFTADANFYTRTAGLLNYNAAYTCMFWVWVSSLANYAHFWGAVNGAEGANDYINSDFVGHDSASTAVRMAAYSATVGTPTLARALPIGDWTHVTLRRSSATLLEVFLNAEPTAVLSDVTDVTLRLSVGTEVLGRLNGAYGLRGRLANLKQWSRALSTAEIFAERASLDPVSTSSINEIWDFIPGANKLVGRLNGYTWTLNGTVNSHAGPPLLSLPSRPNFRNFPHPVLKRFA